MQFAPAPASFFAGRKILVTGGAAGIGRATTDLLLSHGAQVAVWDLQDAALSDLSDAHPDMVHAQKVDVSDYAAVEAAMAKLAADWGPIDHLMNNAGIIGRRMSVRDYDPVELDRVLGVNLRSAFHVSHAFVSNMSAREGRSIVNLSSIAGRTGGMVGNIAYATTKGAIASFTVALAKELAPEVRVNALAPGVIDTAIQKDVFADPAKIEAMSNVIPMHRLGTAAEVAEAAVWLLSPASSYITAVLVDVSGGR
ncbi:SDR family NAD(P)-dependent oxidoreductase [Frigidibacter sp. MR17.24]|uniref:SDR family NAD(P)-dependent oxidoreductase n=1 Tax=Frigidibacter sp. MR17.24 TaxID=3127345 RepID=UPI0030130F1E